MNKDPQTFALKIVFLISIYLMVAITVYRFRHPDKTETRLFLDFVDALLWR